MNKIYQRIDWENYPSSATPLNEDNLNKMDYAIDKLDDRIVTHETTKLNTATGNTLVKNVTFNEKTGVFTIEKLSGSKITINTALEKIATNFRYDYSTQKLILTLIDGTTQEVDLSALLTQYEFLNSSTIQFTIDSSGKVKASVVNGSITGNMLEPNYLANVTLQAKNAKTSADNAKTSEELAYQYAEEAKESASQTAKSDAKNITYDNTESGLSATNVKDALDEVAQCSVSAIATDTTITDSTNAPLVRLKVKGKTEQFTTTGRNKLKVEDTNNHWQCTVTVSEDGKATLTNTATSGVAYANLGSFSFKANETYTISVKNAVNLRNYTFLKKGTSESADIAYASGNVTVTPTENIDTDLVVYMKDISTTGKTTSLYIQIEEGSTASAYEPFTNGASPNPDYPQEINGLAKDGAIEVKTCGKNLMKVEKLENSWQCNVSVADDGEITLTNTETTGVVYGRVGLITFKANKTYTISVKDVENLRNYTFFKKGTLESADIAYASGTVTVKPTADVETELIVYMNDISASNKTTSLYIQIEEGDTSTTYEPYTETTANIPTDAPLYEGDYIEVYADGSGKLVRTMGSVVFDGSDDENLTAHTTGIKGNFIQLLLNDIKQGANLISSQLQVTNPYNNAGSCIYALTTNNGIWFRISDDITSVADTRAWLRSKPMTVVYELATPTETPLTAEQVAQFKQLYTFEPVTNVLCDGEVEIQYYKNTSSGVAMATVHKKTLLFENTTVDVFTDKLGEWNSISINDDVTLRGITYGNGKLVAVGDDGAVYYSEDNGETWSTANASQTMYSVTYGKGLFVAVSADDFCTSPDGITWTVRKEVGDVLYSVTYGGDKKLFVAFGTEYADGNYTLHNYYSPDGINWYSAEIGYFTEAYCNVKYIPEEGIFLGVCGVHTFSSSDGISFSAIGVCESTSKLQSITCGNGMYVAIDDNGDIFYNANPTSVSIWTRGASLGVALYDVIFKNGLFIAVGSIRATYYSEYGMSWNSFGTGVTGSGDLYSITYNHGKFIAVGGNGSIFAVEYSKESKNLQDAINELYLQLK